MPTHKSSDYKLSAVKYYLSHSKNQVPSCKIFGCSEISLIRGAYDRSEKYVKRPSRKKGNLKNIWIRSAFKMFKGVKHTLLNLHM